MADLKNNALSQEEQLSGFNPGEPDDDTFALPDSAEYTGNLDDWKPVENPVEAELQAPFEQERTAIEADNRGIEEIAQEIKSEKESIKPIIEEEPLQELEQEPIFSTPFFEEPDNMDENIDKNIFEEPEIEADVPQEKIFADDDFASFEEPAPVAKTESEYQPMITEDDDQLDLAAFIQSQKDITDKRKNEIALETKHSSKAEDTLPPSDYIPVEGQVDNINTIDLTNLDIHDDEKQKSAPAVAIPVSKTKTTKEQVKKTKKEKSDSSPLVFLLIGSAATLLLFIILAGLYIYFLKPDIYALLFDKTQKTELVTETTDDEQDTEKASEVTTKTKETTVKEETTETATEETKSTSESKIAKETELARDTELEKIEEAKVEVPKTVAPKPVTAPVRQPVTQVSQATQKPAKPVAKTPPVVTPVVVTPVQTPPATTTDIAQQKVLEETYTDFDEEGIYTVQIYASPSQKDAEEWLNKLKDKSISNSFISTQQIRGQTWYRVRFGEFSTKEEARLAALRYGFAQTWIDRVK